MPHQDPKLLKTETSRVLMLHRDELQLLLYNCVSTTGVKSHLFKAYSQIKKYFSGHKKLKLTKNRVTKVLESLMPFAQETHLSTIAKIFNVLTAMPKDANLIHVDIYVATYNPKHEPAIMSVRGDELLEKVRLARSCGICMDEFEKGVIAIRLPCLHIFHGNCIFRWLEKDHTCPLCRHSMSHDEPDNTFYPVTVYRHSYYSEIELKTCTPAPSSMLHIQFNLYESNQDGLLRENGKVSITSMLKSKQFHLEPEPRLLTIPSHCELQPTMLTQVLRSMSVPRHEQLPIVAKIFETVASNNADHGSAFINANIYHETLELFDLRAFRRWSSRTTLLGIDHFPNTNEIIDARAREFAEEELFINLRTKPATKSAIDGLERVRVDKTCGICMDDFEDGLASRLPCLHIFHGDCVRRWLETDYKCPLCRYPLLCD